MLYAAWFDNCTSLQRGRLVTSSFSMLSKQLQEHDEFASVNLSKLGTVLVGFETLVPALPDQTRQARTLAKQHRSQP